MTQTAELTDQEDRELNEFVYGQPVTPDLPLAITQFGGAGVFAVFDGWHQAWVSEQTGTPLKKRLYRRYCEMVDWGCDLAAEMFSCYFFGLRIGGESQADKYLLHMRASRRGPEWRAYRRKRFEHYLTHWAKARDLEEEPGVGAEAQME